jgi:hypothetical protein
MAEDLGLIWWKATAGRPSFVSWTTGYKFEMAKQARVAKKAA